MATWKKLPAEAKFSFAGDALKKAWPQLHAADQEPFPKDAKLADAWRKFHEGDFQGAVKDAVALGDAGGNLANLATSIYANYLETGEASRIKLFQEVMARAEANQKSRPDDAGGFYHYAYAAGRYSQGISVVKALAEGYGGKIRTALEKALALQPKHAHAHVAMGAYHAEIIDKVGALVGGLTYGAKKDLAEKHFKEALKLVPKCPIAMIEYANGMLMLYGGKQVDAATKLYVTAAGITPKDAMEWLDVQAAKEELEDE